MHETSKPSWQFRRTDLYLILCLAAAGIIIVILMARGTAQSDQVVITVDGKAYGSWKLSENTSIDIRSEEGTNVVTIQDGMVWMEQASCRNQVCVETGRISRPGQVIVCLPNRVVVEIKAGEGSSSQDQDFDAVVR